MDNKLENVQEDQDLEQNVAEQEVNAGVDATSQEPAPDSQKEIEEMKERLKESHDKLLRSMAEVENLRVRSKKMSDEARDYSILNFARDLLPVIDNLNRAKEQAQQQTNQNMADIMDGMNLTIEEFLRILSKHGIESISPQSGDKFDYNYHNAVSQIVTEEHKAGSIVAVMQIGYKIKERLLRPATVSVAK